MPEIRQIVPSDAEAAADLSEQLGYPVSPAEMQQRIEALGNQPGHAVFVACAGPNVVAWIDIGIVQHLQVEPYAEIGGLVVAANHRSNGLGRDLVQKAEQWAKSHQMKRIVVRSRIGREGAHRFYLREGYEQTKISAVFTKALNPS